MIYMVNVVKTQATELEVKIVKMNVWSKNT